METQEERVLFLLVVLHLALTVYYICNRSAIAFEDEDSRVLIGAKVRFADQSLLFEFPNRFRLVFEMRSKLLGRGVGILDFKRNQFHSQFVIGTNRSSTKSFAA